MRQTTNPSSLHDPLGYTHVVSVSGGDTIYVAGQVAWGTDGQLVGPDDFEAQTRQVFSNLEAALEGVGAGLAELVRIAIYVVDHDLERLGIIRDVRDELFGEITPPASTLLGVASLAVPGLMIEIDGIAVIDG